MREVPIQIVRFFVPTYGISRWISSFSRVSVFPVCRRYSPSAVSVTPLLFRLKRVTFSSDSRVWICCRTALGVIYSSPAALLKLPVRQTVRKVFRCGRSMDHFSSPAMTVLSLTEYHYKISGMVFQENPDYNDISIKKY